VQARLVEDEEELVEFFGQLWVINSPPPRSRVPLASDATATFNPWNLFWIRKELVRSKKISPEDCFPVRRSDRFDGPPVKLIFVKDIWGRGGEKDSYSAVLKRDSMAKGGCWVWQPEPR